jgi:hypothetical protein
MRSSRLKKEGAGIAPALSLFCHRRKRDLRKTIEDLKSLVYNIKNNIPLRNFFLLSGSVGIPLRNN